MTFFLVLSLLLSLGSATTPASTAAPVSPTASASTSAFARWLSDRGGWWPSLSMQSPDHLVATTAIPGGTPVLCLEEPAFLTPYAAADALDLGAVLGRDAPSRFSAWLQRDRTARSRVVLALFLVRAWHGDRDSPAVEAWRPWVLGIPGDGQRFPNAWTERERTGGLGFPVVDFAEEKWGFAEAQFVRKYPRLFPAKVFTRERFLRAFAAASGLAIPDQDAGSVIPPVMTLLPYSETAGVGPIRSPDPALHGGVCVLAPRGGLKPGDRLQVDLPSWRGRTFLNLAFVFGFLTNDTSRDALDLNLRVAAGANVTRLEAAGACPLGAAPGEAPLCGASLTARNWRAVMPVLRLAQLSRSAEGGVLAHSREVLDRAYCDGAPGAPCGLPGEKDEEDAAFDLRDRFLRQFVEEAEVFEEDDRDWEKRKKKPLPEKRAFARKIRARLIAVAKAIIDDISRPEGPFAKTEL
jgi:hypothetical protein